MQMPALRIAFLIVLLIMTVSDASYSTKVIVKFPFASSHYDTSGNWVTDSLVRYHEMVATIYRTEKIDSLEQKQKTDDCGEAVFAFDNWHDGTDVDTANIVQLDIVFPNTEKVTRLAGEENKMGSNLYILHYKRC